MPVFFSNSSRSMTVALSDHALADLPPPSKRGGGNSDSSRSGSPASTWLKLRRGCSTGWRPDFTARWTTWPGTDQAQPTGGTGSRHGAGYRSADGLSTARRRRPVGVLNQPELGYVSRYALGRDYHKVLRQPVATAGRPHRRRHWSVRLSGVRRQRPGAGKSAGRKGGLGWIGKHSNLLDRQAGSWFFLGEIYVDLPLPIDQPVDRALRALHLPVWISVRPRPLSRRTGWMPAAAFPITPSNGMGRFRWSFAGVRQPDLRLRRLPDGLSVEPLRPTDGEPDFRDPAWSGRAELMELFGWDEAEFLRRTEGQRHPPDRP
jgi:hypothetical protein